MVSSFRQPTHVGTVKRSTTHYDLEVPYFDTPNWGQYVEADLDVLDALIFSMAGITNVLGVWENGTAYTVGQRVIDPDTGFIYEVKVNHTSAVAGTFLADRTANPTYWQIMQTGWSFRGAWAQNTAYLVGDVAYQSAQHVIGVCTTAHTSTAVGTIRTDAIKWNFIVDLLATVTAAELAETNAETAETNAETAETNAETAATTSTTQAGISTTQAGNSATSAAAALVSENNSATHETNAELAETNAEAAEVASEAARDTTIALVDYITDRFLIPKITDPALDDDGNALVDGAVYWNTVSIQFRIYDQGTTTWYPAPSLLANAIDVAYDNTASGLTATNMQAALDEILSQPFADADYGEVIITAGVWTLETAAILTRLLTVDGAGSTLDSDLLDGQHGSHYLARANHTGTQLAATVSDFSTAADARVAAAVGVTVQAWSANLDEYSAVNPSAYALALFDDTTLAGFLTSLGVAANMRSLIAAADYAAARALLDLEAGTDFLSVAAIAAAYQPLDSGLTALATYNTNGLLVQSANNTFVGRTLTGTANEITVSNGDGVSGAPTISLPTVAKATGRQEFWISAGGMKRAGTNGAANGDYDSGSNDVLLDTKDFDQTTSESVYFEFGMPAGWDEGTVTFIPYWTADAGTATQTCIFTLSGIAISNDDPMNAAQGTGASSSDALIATGDLHIGPESSAITIGGTPAVNDLAVFKLLRDISDTLAADAKLIGIKLVLNFASANDS